MKALWILLSAVPLVAAVDGVVMNRTTGKPQPDSTVTIYVLGGAGMESIETVKSGADGRFQLSYTPGSGPHLLQAVWDGVIYNKMLPPGAPSTNLEVDVYNAQKRPGESRITQHMMLIEPIDGKLIISENVIYQNSGNVTFNDPDNGTLQFYLPPATGGKVKVTAQSPSSVPVERAAIPTRTANVYGVDVPIKPGETRFQLTYEMPMPDPPVFTSRLLHKEGTTRLVTPSGVSIKGEGITEMGREPQTQAMIYNLSGQEVRVEIEGTGALREAAANSGEEDGPGIQEIMPRVYDNLYAILGLCAAILVLGLILLFRRQTPVAAGITGPKGKRTG